LQSEHALISVKSIIHPSAKIWAFAEIRENSVIGQNTIIGSKVYVGTGVKIGANSKIQNNSLIYEPSLIGDGVFVGPGVILTNDKNPRSTTVDGRLKESADWEPQGVQILSGASIGAGAICIGPLVIGRWALVGAGSVVTRDVSDYELVAGVPAKHLGWVGRAGFKLQMIDEGTFVCPKTSEVYFLDPSSKLARVES
jgi:UDP-2-acetamido-3-amino-2,3-dideoxy-glucuronate N-acetyltransferase